MRDTASREGRISAYSELLRTKKSLYHQQFAKKIIEILK